MPTLQMGVGLEYGDYTGVGDKSLPSNSLCLMALQLNGVNKLNQSNCDMAWLVNLQASQRVEAVNSCLR